MPAYPNALPEYRPDELAELRRQWLAEQTVALEPPPTGWFPGQELRDRMAAPGGLGGWMNARAEAAGGNQYANWQIGQRMAPMPGLEVSPHAGGGNPFGEQRGASIFAAPLPEAPWERSPYWGKDYGSSPVVPMPGPGRGSPLQAIMEGTRLRPREARLAREDLERQFQLAGAGMGPVPTGFQPQPGQHLRPAERRRMEENARRSFELQMQGFPAAEGGQAAGQRNAAQAPAQAPQRQASNGSNSGGRARWHGRNPAEDAQRIDARPADSRAANIRNAQRDTGGNIVGGYRIDPATGQRVPFGTSVDRQLRTSDPRFAVGGSSNLDYLRGGGNGQGGDSGLDWLQANRRPQPAPGAPGLLPGGLGISPETNERLFRELQERRRAEAQTPISPQAAARQAERLRGKDGGDGGTGLNYDDAIDSALHTGAEALFAQSESAKSREGGPLSENPFAHGRGTVRPGGGGYRMVNAYGNPHARKQVRARGDLARA